MKRIEPLSRDQRLIAFAERVLATLEGRLDWDPDTLESIGCDASSLGLAVSDDEGCFEVVR